MAATIVKQLCASKDTVPLVDHDHTAMITITMIATTTDQPTAAGEETTIRMCLNDEASMMIEVLFPFPTVRTRSDNFQDDRRSRRYSSYSDSSRSRTPPRKERRKSTTEEVLKSLGLAGVAGAVLGKKSGSRSRSRDRGGRSRSRRGRSSSSSRSRGGKKKDPKAQVTEALKAALLAGVGAAVVARKEPGGWGGDKGKRVLTAAISAGGVDGLLSHNRDGKDHGTRDVIGSALAGLATNRIVNGPRSKSRGPGSRSPDSRAGRSQSRGGIGDLAAGGVLAATGKKVWDHVRSRSRGRGEDDRGRARSRGSSYGSDSRSPPPRQRSRSVAGGLAKGLSAVGLNSVADKVDPERRKSRGYDDYDDRSSRNGGYRDSRDVGPLTPYAPENGPGPVAGQPRSLSASRAPGGQYQLDYGPHHTGDSQTDSDSDLGSSSGEEKEIKKSKKKSLVTAGLASVATIHAAHSVYQSMEKREARQKALKEGDITSTTARRERNKARLQDVASVGIAALGIKGAYSEWNEMREHRHGMKEEAEKVERHKEKREARRRKASLLQAQQYKEGGYTGSMPNLHPSGDHGRDAGQPTYGMYGDNPYAAYDAPLQHGAYTPPQYHGPPPAATFPPPPGATYTPPPPQHQYHQERGYTPAPEQQYQPGPAYTPPPPHDQYIPPPPMGPARSETR